jgi:DNA repair protein RadC
VILGLDASVQPIGRLKVAEDIILTKRLEEVSAPVDISLLDPIILTRDSSFRLLEHGFF